MSTMTRRGRIGTDLTQGPVMKTLVKFTVPMVIASIIQQVYSMTDLVIIGHYMGNIGTVGVSVGGEIADMLMPIASAISMGGQIYLAQLIGAKAEGKLKDAIGTLFSMMLLMSVAAAVVIVVFYNQFLNMLNCPSEAASQVASYMIITAIGTPFVFGYNAISGILRGFGLSLIFVNVFAMGFYGYF